MQQKEKEEEEEEEDMLMVLEIIQYMWVHICEFNVYSYLKV